VDAGEIRGGLRVFVDRLLVVVVVSSEEHTKSERDGA